MLCSRLHSWSGPALGLTSGALALVKLHSVASSQMHFRLAENSKIKRHSFILEDSIFWGCSLLVLLPCVPCTFEVVDA